MTSYDFERYLNVRNAYGASFDSTGERLSFLLDTTGVPQVWQLDGPQTWPRQSTFYDERVTFVSWSPERDELAFGMDDGGNERQQLFRLDGDGETVTPLTAMPTPNTDGVDGTPTVHSSRSPRTDGTTPSSTYTYRTEMGLGTTPTMVYEGDGGSRSPDGVPTMTASWWSNPIPRSTGTSRPRHPIGRHRTRHAARRDVRYQESTAGVRKATRSTSSRTTSPTRCISPASTSHLRHRTRRGRRKLERRRLALDEEFGNLVYSRNEDGYTELTAGELTDGTTIREFPTPDLPRRNRGRHQFRRRRRTLRRLRHRAAREHQRLRRRNRNRRAERWTDASPAGLPTDFREPELVHFESFDGRSIPAFFSVPDGATAGRTPVIVDIHGGPEGQRRPSFGAVKQYFLNRGYAYFEPNVRGSSGYGKEYTHLDDVEKRMDSVADVEAGVEWLPTNRRRPRTESSPWAAPTAVSWSWRR